MTDEERQRFARRLRERDAEIERLRAALQEIAGNKTNSRAWLEDKARRALEPKP
jgi:arginine deiminase